MVVFYLTGLLKVNSQRVVGNVNKLGDPDYESKVQKEGFTISTGATNLLTRIKTSRIFNVYENQGKTIGYIDIDKEIYFPEQAKNIIWFNKTLKDIYFQGIAKELLMSAIKELRRSEFEHLFSIITTGPVKNFPSISFHTKFGFTKICETKPINLFGLKNYESALFYLRP